MAFTTQELHREHSSLFVSRALVPTRPMAKTYTLIVATDSNWCPLPCFSTSVLTHMNLHLDTIHLAGTSKNMSLLAIHNVDVCHDQFIRELEELGVGLANGTILAPNIQNSEDMIHRAIVARLKFIWEPRLGCLADNPWRYDLDAELSDMAKGMIAVKRRRKRGKKAHFEGSPDVELQTWDRRVGAAFARQAEILNEIYAAVH
ncbi:hypothetical protein C8R43DRAFT_1103338 [Mycena crocata]|nr:hypothetical protein C8R43DRAFT_1103338 [Mycena crocata]